jgi:hypothetical protein
MYSKKFIVLTPEFNAATCKFVWLILYQDKLECLTVSNGLAYYLKTLWEPAQEELFLFLYYKNRLIYL